MSSNSGKTPEQLRLASALRRVRAFLAEVESLKASNFPHRDGRDALDAITENFAEYVDPIEDPDSASMDTINSVCLEISYLVELYTGVLGFILRSTNVRNPFEIHYPLKRLVTDVLGPEAKLLISSEWDFIPLTYPMSLEKLPGFVLVGGPAPESGNVLITPLAGHEIGHSVWRQSDFPDVFEAAIEVRVETELSKLPQAKRDLFSEFKMGELGEELVRQDCVSYAMQQIEEIFCDFFGLGVFGSSYLYAFEYFLAPGGEVLSLEYPSSQRRMALLEDASSSLKLVFHSSPFKNWLQGKPASKREGVLAEIVDASVEPLVRNLKDEAFRVLQSAEVVLPRPGTVLEITEAFRFVEPYAKEATLAEIVTAGWIVVQQSGGMSDPAGEAKLPMLNDVMLKSVEVSEYLLKVPGA